MADPASIAGSESPGGVIDGEVAKRLRCRILAEGANGPTTPDADEVLDQRKDEIVVLPDILCNAGGVIVSYFEWVQDLQRFFWTELEARPAAAMRPGRMRPVNTRCARQREPATRSAEVPRRTTRRFGLLHSGSAILGASRERPSLPGIHR